MNLSESAIALACCISAGLTAGFAGTAGVVASLALLVGPARELFGCPKPTSDSSVLCDETRCTVIHTTRSSPIAIAASIAAFLKSRAGVAVTVRFAISLVRSRTRAGAIGLLAAAGAIGTGTAWGR